MKYFYSVLSLFCGMSLFKPIVSAVSHQRMREVTQERLDSSNSVCYFQMNGPAFALSDGNMIGISAIPVRDYYVRFRVYPRSVIAERQTSLLEVATTSLQVGPSKVPSVGFLSNSTRPIVSFYTDSKTGLRFAATRELPLNQWTEISVYLDGKYLTLVCLNQDNSFANRIVLPFARNVVNSAFIYAASNNLPAASALVQNILVCTNNEVGLPSPTAAPTFLRTRAPTPLPTTEPTPLPTPEPTLEPTPEPTPLPTPEPTLEPTYEPTTQATAILTIIVPAPTSEPTSEPTPGIPGLPIEPELPEMPELRLPEVSSSRLRSESVRLQGERAPDEASRFQESNRQIAPREARQLPEPMYGLHGQPRLQQFWHNPWEVHLWE